MSYDLETLRSFEDKQVKMAFDDDHEVIATLLSASQDLDGSLHLVYDRVTWANDPREFATAQDSTCYAEGESLVNIEVI
jgi:hypothetical protein